MLCSSQLLTCQNLLPETTYEKPTKSVTVTPWQSKDAGPLPIMIGGWLKVERGGGGDAKDSCKHYHPSLSQSIDQVGWLGALGRTSLPQKHFYAKPNPSAGTSTHMQQA